MNINDMSVKIATIQNKLRDLNNEINRIAERGEMEQYVEGKEAATVPVYFSVGIGNCVFKVTSEELMPIIQAVMERDAITITNMNTALDNALEALS